MAYALVEITFDTENNRFIDFAIAYSDAVSLHETIHDKFDLQTPEHNVKSCKN